MVVRALCAALILAAIAAAVSAQDSSPFLAYSPQAVCAQDAISGQSYWVCDVSALHDPDLTGTAGWRISGAGESIDVLDLSGEDYYDLVLGCIPSGIEVDIEGIEVCGGLASTLGGAAEIELRPIIRDGGVTTAGLAYTWRTEPDTEEGFELWFRAETVDVLGVDISDETPRRLVLALRPPKGTQHTQLRIGEQGEAERTYTLQTDYTADDAHNIFAVQALVPAALRDNVAFSVRGRNWGGDSGLTIYDDPMDTSTPQGYTPPRTYGYTPWSQLYRVQIAPRATDDALAPPPVHDLVKGLAELFGSVTGSEQDPRTFGAIFIAVVAAVLGSAIWIGLRGASELWGGVLAFTVALMVWAILGAELAAVPIALAYGPLIVPGILAVFGLRGYFT